MAERSIEEYRALAEAAGWTVFDIGGPEPYDELQYWRPLGPGEEGEQEDDIDPETGVRSIISANARSACIFDRLIPDHFELLFKT